MHIFKQLVHLHYYIAYSYKLGAYYNTYYLSLEMTDLTQKLNIALVKQISLGDAHQHEVDS